MVSTNQRNIEQHITCSPCRIVNDAGSWFMTNAICDRFRASICHGDGLGAFRGARVLSRLKVEPVLTYDRRTGECGMNLDETWDKNE